MHKSIFVAGTVSLLVAGVLVHGCSESSTRYVPAGATASGVTSALAVVATSPGHGDTGVAVTDPIYVTFSADIDPASVVAGAITLSKDTGPVAVTLQPVTPRVVSVQPAAHLSSTTSHVLLVTTQIRDVNQNSLAADEVVRFTTDVTVPIRGPGGPSVVPPATPSPYSAGVASVDITPHTGVPLAGFGGGDRRHTPLPDLNPFNDYTFLNPATGVKDPIMAKALVLTNGTEQVCIVTLDAIATEAGLVELAHRKAAAQGFSIPLEKILVCSSHTHSGPGAVSKKLVWQVIAADLYRSGVADDLADGIAQAMVDAEQGAAPAQVGVGSAQVPTSVVSNRRHGDSPLLDPDDVDPEMVVLRVDDMSGNPIATVWNFAIHGTHFGSSNMEFSADIMGSASNKAQLQGAGECMFINGAEGDIKPRGTYDGTGQILADSIVQARQAATPSASGVLQSVHEIVDLGQPTLSYGLSHIGGSVSSSWWAQGLQQLGIAPQVNFAIPNGWVERSFRFQAIRVGDGVITSIPGEAIHQIGLDLKADGRTKGFGLVMPAGLANGHGSYFTTPVEYGYGGYEGMASLFGPDNGDKVVDACKRLMDLIKP